METKKEAFKKFVIEQLKDFDYWREASPEGYAETIVDEAVKLFCQPAVSSRFFIPESAQGWLLTGDRGISSETIFGAITGLVINRRKHPPADPADFYRCYKLIKAVPEWKSELHKVAELSKPWENVIDNWDKLSELLEEQIEWRDKGISASNGMYEFMKQLGC